MSKELNEARQQALILVDSERSRQISLWGANDHFNNDLGNAILVLGEEFGEVCEAINETLCVYGKRPEKGGKNNIIKEASHVAAVAVKIIEMLLLDDTIPEVMT